MERKRKQSIRVLGKQVALFIALVGLAGYLLFLYVGSLLNAGAWKTLIDQQYGYSFEYPANWDAETYGESGFRSYHNLKASAFTDTLFFTAGHRSVRIHWMPMDNPTREQVAMWGAEEIEQYEGFNISEQVDVQIGLQHYPAVLQTYQTRNLFKQVYYVHNEDSAYIIELRAGQLDHDTESIFEHILATFQLFDRSKK
ncbi:MAG: hypothetical protein IPL78_13025 [Chloroflexi bacterium]|nr:hypothetical protein [Chloroflexota bacterium]